MAISLTDALSEVEEIIYRYRKTKCMDTKIRYHIPFSAFNYENNLRVLGFYKLRIEMFYNSNNIKVLITEDYVSSCFVIYEVLKMKRIITIAIPYASRSDYFPAIYKINKLVSNDGCAIMAVDNNFYDLQSLLYIETSSDFQEINKIVSKYNLKFDTSVGLEEIISDIGGRKYNTFSLSPCMPQELLFKALSSLYLFPEKKQLEELGYSFNRKKKKKVFISYTHKDKKAVHSIADYLEDEGLNIWIDKKAIDIGDNILASISEEIRECDLHIIFLSENTKNAAYAKHELLTIFSEVIQQRYKWFIVRLDNVNPNDIYPGLGNYLYFDLFDNDNEKLIEKIKSKLDKI